MNKFKRILPIIVISQFCCTTVWFASNAVLGDLVTYFHLNETALGHLVSAVQFGFIIGTLSYALLTIADRFSPSKVFFISAGLCAVFNLTVIWHGNNFVSIVVFRFLTGFFLAGIYPVGMKIAADYYEKGLGKSLGFLVGALVIGTAFPHLLIGLNIQINWQWVVVTTSLLAIVGGVLMFALVPNGPYRKSNPQLNVMACFKAFKNEPFKIAAIGYFGHMWELYTFWAFTPILLKMYVNLHPTVDFNTPFLSFLIIASGGLACAVVGYVSQLFSVKQTAFWSLFLSCLCCICLPFMFFVANDMLFIAFLFFWGMVVVADSPMFSTLIAQNASPEIKVIVYCC